MCLLKMEDIVEWLADNKANIEFERSKSHNYIDADFNSLVFSLEGLVELYKHKSISEFAINELKSKDRNDDISLMEWCSKYKELGKEMFSFAIHYLWWDGTVYTDRIKIDDDVFAERKPFENMICISDIFVKIIVDKAYGNDDGHMFSESNLADVHKIINNFFKFDCKS